MKRLNLRNYSKQFLPATLLSILSAAIWFGGPFITIANYHPFDDAEKRGYLILLILLLWALKIFLMDHPQPKKTSTLSADQSKKILALDSRFKGAIQFLKKTLLNMQGKKVNLFQLPWYLLVGPEGSGKTTLLANANVSYVLAKQFKQENLSQLNPSDNYDWWVTRNLVLVDVPANHLFEEKAAPTKSIKPSNHFLWQHFLELIKKFRRKNPLSGVVITLNLPELVKQENYLQKGPFLPSLRNCILQLKEQFDPQMPFYLIITKCDMIPGFIEFFGDCTSDELAQTWGITIPPLDEKEKLTEIFLNRFNALIKRLNKQLISSLHQERNPNARPYIKDFPLQIERIKESIAHFLKAINIPNLNLQGVYLTSAIQSTRAEEQSAQLPAPSYQQPQNMLQLLHQPVRAFRSFFVRQLILQGLLNTFEHPPVQDSKEKTWQKRIIYTTAIFAITITAILLGRDFQQGVQQAYSLQNLLSQYQIALQHENAGINHLAKALPLLDALQDAAQQHGYQFSRFSSLTIYTNKSQQTAEQIYHQALQTIVIPQIKSFLETYLQNPADKNPVRTYAALKAYLMLNNTNILETAFVLNTITQLLPHDFNTKERAQLANHLQIGLTELQPLPLDDNIIQKTRKLLLNFPRAQLAFIILKNIGNNNLDSSISLGTNSKPLATLTTKEVTNQIPNLFTALNFQTVLSDQIPSAANQALHGNAVLGEASVKISPSEEIALSQELEKQYITNYIDIWESLLANIQIVAPTSLAQTDLILTTLTSEASPLIQLLQTLQQNTTFALIQNASPKLQALNALLININNQGNTLYQLFVGMKDLHTYLQTILHTSDPAAAAFFAAKNRMQHTSMNDPISQMRMLAEKSPEPIKVWFEKLTDHSWHFILEEAGHHIQYSWKTTVIPYYLPMVNRFPLNPTATEEVDLQKFTNFFKPHGTLTSFYQSFLKPFINDSSKEWQWKRFDNAELPLSKSLLQQMQYAQQLQHALFPNDDDKLFVSFTLQPISLDKGASTVSLNINGQLITYQQSTPRLPRLLTWPGNNALHNTVINFSTLSQLPSIETTRGDWAWFRMVNKATQTIISRKELALSFNINGHTARYTLFTQGHLNPFLPLNWERLQLPEELI